MPLGRITYRKFSVIELYGCDYENIINILLKHQQGFINDDMLISVKSLCHINKELKLGLNVECEMFQDSEFIIFKQAKHYNNEPSADISV